MKGQAYLYPGDFLNCYKFLLQKRCEFLIMRNPPNYYEKRKSLLGYYISTGEKGSIPRVNHPVISPPHPSLSSMQMLPLELNC